MIDFSFIKSKSEKAVFDVEVILCNSSFLRENYGIPNSTQDCANGIWPQEPPHCYGRNWDDIFLQCTCATANAPNFPTTVLDVNQGRNFVNNCINGVIAERKMNDGAYQYYRNVRSVSENWACNNPNDTDEEDNCEDQNVFTGPHVWSNDGNEDGGGLLISMAAKTVIKVNDHLCTAPWWYKNNIKSRLLDITIIHGDSDSTVGNSNTEWVAVSKVRVGIATTCNGSCQ